MRQVTKEEHDTPPDLEWARAVCLIGQGAACCRYLGATAKGFSCGKLDDKQFYDQRVAEGRMVSVGDNCTGRASR